MGEKLVSTSVRSYHGDEVRPTVKWYNPAADRIAPLPDWGSKDLKIGALRHVIRQLGLDWEEFKRA